MFYNTPPLTSLKLRGAKAECLAIPGLSQPAHRQKNAVEQGSAWILLLHWKSLPKNNFCLSGGCKWIERRENSGGHTAENIPSLPRVCAGVRTGRESYPAFKQVLWCPNIPPTDLQRYWGRLFLHPGLCSPSLCSFITFYCFSKAFAKCPENQALWAQVPLVLVSFCISALSLSFWGPEKLRLGTRASSKSCLL